MMKLSSATEVQKLSNVNCGAANRHVELFFPFQLVNEVNHQVALYRQLLQSIGTLSDSASVRKEVVNTRLQCLKTCDTTKNCVLPQLKRYSSSIITVFSEIQ